MGCFVWRTLETRFRAYARPRLMARQVEHRRTMGTGHQSEDGQERALVVVHPGAKALPPALHSKRFRVSETFEHALAQVREASCSLIFADERSLDSVESETLRKVRESNPAMPVVLLSTEASVGTD